MLGDALVRVASEAEALVVRHSSPERGKPGSSHLAQPSGEARGEGAGEHSGEGSKQVSVTTGSRLCPPRHHQSEPEEDKTPEWRCCPVWANSSSVWQDLSISAPSLHLLRAHVYPEREIIAAQKPVQEMLNASIFLKICISKNCFDSLRFHPEELSGVGL